MAIKKINKNIFEGKNILITGGCGTVGSEILRQILEYNPKVVRIIEINEEKLFEMNQKYQDRTNVRFLLGNITDKERMMRAFENIDIVFHAAALKHIFACEYSPFEAAKTNIFGTQNVIEAAISANVELFIYTSSDKAVNPSNVMGASKLFAEKLVTTANYYRGPNRRTKFCSVRFGNVLGSSGSVVPLFKKQIANGGPITVTDCNMTRFVMFIDQAVSLIFKAATIAQGGEIFILKMPVLNIKDMAEAMIDELAPKNGFKPGQIKIKVTCPQPGEKLYEELLTDDEIENAYETEDLYVLLSQYQKEYLKYADFSAYKKKASIKSCKSKDLPMMTKEEIKKFLKSGNLL